jgi:hypothetical protein
MIELMNECTYVCTDACVRLHIYIYIYIYIRSEIVKHIQFGRPVDHVPTMGRGTAFLPLGPVCFRIYSMILDPLDACYDFPKARSANHLPRSLRTDSTR